MIIKGSILTIETSKIKESKLALNRWQGFIIQNNFLILEVRTSYLNLILQNHTCIEAKLLNELGCPSLTKSQRAVTCYEKFVIDKSVYI